MYQILITEFMKMSTKTKKPVNNVTHVLSARIRTIIILIMISGIYISFSIDMNKALYKVKVTPTTTFATMY